LEVQVDNHNIQHGERCQIVAFARVCIKASFHVNDKQQFKSQVSFDKVVVKTVERSRQARGRDFTAELKHHIS